MTFDTMLVPSNWSVGSALTTGDLHGYYDSNGPAANCHGYPYVQLKYSGDPIKRLIETGYPDDTWRVGSGTTTRLKYLSNDDLGDSPDWDGRTLSKLETKDEGGLIAVEFRDRLGRVVQQNLDSVNTPIYGHLFRHDIRGNPIQLIRPRAGFEVDSMSYTYDAQSRITSENSGDAGLVRYLYDKDGNLRLYMDAARNALNKFVYYKYDALNRKVEEGIYTDTTAFTQTNADNTLFPTSGGAVQFTFWYDSTGSSGSFMLFPSNGRGRLSSWNAGSAYTRRLAYDQLGRVTSESVKIDSLTTLAYGYDWQGNLKTFQIATKPVFPQVQYKYDMANRLIGVGNSTSAYRYDSLVYWPWGGLKTQALKTTAAAVGQTIDYTYNPRDWLFRINDTSSVGSGTTGNSDHFALQLGYGKLFNGDIDSIQFKHSGQSVSWEKMTYDVRRRLSRWHPGLATDTTGDEIFQYDYLGNVLNWKLGDTTAGFNHTYWTNTNRLKKIGASADYTYDASGHLMSEPGRSFATEYRNIASSITFPKGNWNNYLNFAYDADLQRIKKVYDAGYTCECEEDESIDPEDPQELKGGSRGLGTLSAGATGQGVKDQRSRLMPEIEDDTLVRANAGPIGECICRAVTTTQYVHTHDGRVVREYVNGVVQRDFLYAGSNRIGVSEKSGSSYKLRYFLTDHLGSTRQTIDSSGMVDTRFDYYPYGNLRPGGLTNYNPKVRYTGKVFDDEEVEQTYYGARYLNEVTLRFNSVDPLQHLDPSRSPYVYARSNPVNVIDPDGQFAGPLILAGALMAAAYVATTPDAANAPSAPSSEGEIPEPARVFMDEVEDFSLEAVGGAIGLGAGYLAAKGVKWMAVKVAAKFADDAVEVASESASRSFGSFSSFKRAMGSAGEGRQWHHIIEQTPGNVERFGAEAIHSTTNVISVSTEVNQTLNSLYSSIRPEITGSTSMTVRQWLSSKPYDAVRAFGQEALKHVQSGVWP